MCEGRVMLKSSLTAVALMGAATSALGQDFSADALTSRAIERRAVEAVIWGALAVNYDLMYQQFLSSAVSPIRSSIGLACRTGGTRR